MGVWESLFGGKGYLPPKTPHEFIYTHKHVIVTYVLDPEVKKEEERIVQSLWAEAYIEKLFTANINVDLASYEKTMKIKVMRVDRSGE